MELIGITYELSHFPYSHVGKFQKLGRPVHPVINKKLLGSLIQLIPEDFTQVASVQIAEDSDILYSDGIAVILFNEADGFPDIKVLQTASRKFPVIEGGLDQ